MRWGRAWKVTRLPGEVRGLGVRAPGGPGPGPGTRAGACCARLARRAPLLPTSRSRARAAGVWTRAGVAFAGCAAFGELLEAGRAASSQRRGQRRGALSPWGVSRVLEALSPEQPWSLALGWGLALLSGRALRAPLLGAPGRCWKTGLGQGLEDPCKLVWVSCGTPSTVGALSHLLLCISR